MRDWIALWLIRMARRLTTWGPTDDHLAEAERHQHWAANERKHEAATIDELEAALYVLAADVEAYHVSCSCLPAPTDNELANLATARRLLASYQPAE